MTEYENFDLEDIIKYVEEERMKLQDIEIENNRKLSAEENIHKLNRKIEDGFYMAVCNVCKFKFKLSCKYTGKYPLCNSHRDYNNRLKYKNENTEAIRILKKDNP